LLSRRGKIEELMMDSESRLGNGNEEIEIKGHDDPEE
jgi:hypothetical protein